MLQGRELIIFEQEHVPVMDMLVTVALSVFCAQLNYIYFFGNSLEYARTNNL